MSISSVEMLQGGNQSRVALVCNLKIAKLLQNTNKNPMGRKVENQLASEKIITQEEVLAYLASVMREGRGRP